MIKEALDGEFNYEVIFISDNAKDGSWDKIKYLNNKYEQKVKGFKLNSNYGQHKAILFGIKEASGDFLITMDEDMQHDPQYIPEMLSCLLNNKLDVVYGNFKTCKKNSIRKFGSFLFRILAGLFIPHLHKSYSPFRIIRSDIMKKLNNVNNIIFIDGILGNTTNKIGDYPIEHFINRRPSSYSILKLFRLASLILISYSGLARFLSVLIVPLLIYFSIKSIINLPDNSSILSGIPAFTILLCSSALVLYIIIQLKGWRHIGIVEKIGDN